MTTEYPLLDSDPDFPGAGFRGGEIRDDARSDDLRERGRRGRGSTAARVSGGAAALALTLAAGTLVFYARQRSGRPRLPDDAPGRSARGRSWSGDRYVVGRTVTINKPRAELYAFWRDFRNLPRFMENIESVETTGPKTSRWTVKAPAGRAVTLETEIVEDREGEVIAWRSTPESQIATDGRAAFRDAPPGRGSHVEAEIAYNPPGGDLGRLVAKLFAREPRQQARRDLKRFKMLMETGEIASSELHPETA